MSDPKHVYFDVHSGRAVVLLKDNTLFLLKVKGDTTVDGPRSPTDGFNILAWFQFDRYVTVQIDIGTHPFEPFQKYMLLRWNAQTLMNRFDNVLNREHPLSFRNRAACAFEYQYNNATSEVRAEFQRVLLEKTISEDMKTEIMPFKKGTVGEQIWNQIVARSRA